MSLLPLAVLLSIMESQRDGEKATKKRSAEDMEETSAAAAAAAAAAPQPAPPFPPLPSSYPVAASSSLLPLPAVMSLAPARSSDADIPSVHENMRPLPPSASLHLPQAPAPLLPSLAPPPAALPVQCAPLDNSSTLSAISIVTAHSAATPQVLTIFTSPFPVMPPSAVVPVSSTSALITVPAAPAEPASAHATRTAGVMSSVSVAAAAPSPSAVATAVPTSSLPTAIRASTPRITLAKAAANLAVSLPTPQRSMSTKALLHLAHTVNPSSVVSQPSSSLSARFSSIPVAALSSSTASSSSSSSAAAISRSRPPPVSVRAHYLSEHIVSECKRRSPALHDMHIDDQFVARGVIEAIENELKNSISIITVRKRHMNAFRSLEGILYFMRYSNSQWMDCRDRALLMDLLYLFSACWLATLQGLQAKRQLTPSNIHNLKEILIEILTFTRQMDSRWAQEMDEEAAAAASGAKAAAAGADKAEQRAVERVDVSKVLGPIVASVLTGEECLRLDVRRLEVMSPTERQETMDETGKLQLQSRIDRWMEQHRGMGGKAYDLTHWNHDQRLPYLLSNRARDQQPAQPTSATAAAADRLLAASAQPASFLTSTGSLFTSTASALDSLSASAAVAAHKPALLVKVEAESSAGSSLSSSMVQSPASAIISSIATSSFSTMPSVGASSSPVPGNSISAAPVFVSSQTGQSITTPSTSTFSSPLSSLPSSAFTVPPQQPLQQQQQHQQQQQQQQAFNSLQHLQFMSEQLASSSSLHGSQPASFPALATSLSPPQAPTPYQLQGTMTSSSFFYTPSTAEGVAAAAAAQSMPAFTSSPSFFHSPQLIQTATGPALVSTLTQTTSAFPGSLMQQQPSALLPPAYLQLTQPLSYAALQQQQQLQWQQRQLEDQQMMIAMLSSLQQPQQQISAQPHLLAPLNHSLYAQQQQQQQQQQHQQQQAAFSALPPAPHSLPRFNPPVNPLFFNGNLQPSVFPFTSTAAQTSFQLNSSLSPSSLYRSAYALPQPLQPPAPPPSGLPPPGPGPGGVG